MARKKTIEEGKAAGPKRARGPAKPPAQAAPVKKNLVVIKGYGAWLEWLEELATRKGMPVTVLIDHAVREVAKREGFRDPPPRF